MAAIKHFAKYYPELLDEWCFEKNINICDPHNIPSTYCKNKVWWICPKCKSEYPATVKARTKSKPTGCPYCSHRTFKRGVNDLKTVNPTLAEEWDEVKNHPLTASDILAGGNEQYYWICKDCSYSWHASIGNRLRGAGCQKCGKNKQIKSYKQTKLKNGTNTLLSKFPEIAADWDYSANEKGPQDYVPSSDYDANWKCHICGNKWNAKIVSRVYDGNKCKVCNQLKGTSFPEQALFYYLKNTISDVVNTYKPQWLGTNKEIDIFIPALNIGIEYDGAFWHSDKKRDTAKGLLIANHGIVLIRIREPGLPSVDDNSIQVTIDKTDDEYKYITDFIIKVLNIIKSNYSNALIIPDVNVKRDEYKIRANYREVSISESIATKNKELLEEWDDEKNNPLKPDMVSPGSEVSVWWKCKTCGYSWSSQVCDRVNGHGCGPCNRGDLWPGHNDLSTLRPDLLNEWDYRNNSISPSSVTLHSNERVNWICKDGHQWPALVSDRVNGSGCPFCSHHKVIPGKTDLLSNFPLISKSWDYDKNNKKPNEVASKSNDEVFWKCDDCLNSWSGVIYSYTRKKDHVLECPFCSGRKLLVGFNDLANKYPNLLEEWDYEHNNVIPSEITFAYTKKVYWKCKASHMWPATIYDRLNGHGCRKCADIDSAIKRSVPVRNVDTGEEYISATVAAQKTGIGRQQIGCCCRGKQKTAGGFHWEYIERMSDKSAQ